MVFSYNARPLARTKLTRQQARVTREPIRATPLIRSHEQPMTQRFYSKHLISVKHFLFSKVHHQFEWAQDYITPYSRHPNRRTLHLPHRRPFCVGRAGEPALSSTCRSQDAAH